MTDTPINKTISGFANTSLAITGRTMDRSGDPGLMTQSLSNDLKAWAQSPLALPAGGWNGCDGLCFLQVPAIGFEFDCSAPALQPIAYGSETQNAQAASSNGTLNSTKLSTSETVFSISFGTQYSFLGEDNLPHVDANLTMDILYTQAHDVASGDCPGTLYSQSCVLRPAIVSYPVYITNDTTGLTSSPTLSLGMTYDMWSSNSSSISPPAFDRSRKQQAGYEVLNYFPVLESHVYGDEPESYLAGLQQGFNMYLGGRATFDYGGNTGWQISQLGNAPQYLTNAPEQRQCGYIYANPMNPDPTANVQSVVAAVNEMMFALATDLGRLATETDMSAMPAGWSNYTAITRKPAVHYQTNVPYMIGAVASIAVCIMLVLPVYWGYWQLGRKVSLGPFEIAHAFRSPMTARANNSTIDGVMESVGQQQVKFGKIVEGDARGVTGIAEPEYVAPLAANSKATRR